MDSNTDAHFLPYWSAMVMNTNALNDSFFFLPLYKVLYMKKEWYVSLLFRKVTFSTMKDTKGWYRGLWSYIFQ